MKFSQTFSHVMSMIFSSTKNNIGLIFYCYYKFAHTKQVNGVLNYFDYFP